MVKDVPQPSSKEKSGLWPKYLTQHQGANILGVKITGTNVLMIWKIDAAKFRIARTHKRQER